MFAWRERGCTAFLEMIITSTSLAVGDDFLAEGFKSLHLLIPIGHQAESVVSFDAGVKAGNIMFAWG